MLDARPIEVALSALLVLVLLGLIAAGLVWYVS